MRSSKSLSVPWKWFSTICVTVPLFFFIQSSLRLCVLPLSALGSCSPPPVPEGVCQAYFCLLILVIPPFSDLPEDAVESTAHRWPHKSTLLWPEQRRAGSFLVEVSRCICFLAKAHHCFYSWKMSSHSLEAEGWVCFWKPHFLEAGIHMDASREKRKAKRSDPGGFLKPMVPEGATPALVYHQSFNQQLDD